MEIEKVSGEIIDDRYKIINILGKGGLGTTYTAINLKTQEKVALKAVSLQHLKDWKQVELIDREARVLAQLNHPAIPKYLDYFQVDTEDNQFFYIIQQLAPGKSLYQLIESGWRSNETEIKKIATQILDIFNYLHSLNPSIIHRDIKPHNLILSDDGKIFLVDFGAVQNTYYNTLMKGSTVVGTYGYMAPEQFKGKATPATDLYGLGATILYLLTHRSPNELPQDNLTINFRSSVNISEGFALWLEKILQPDLESRFSSAQEALEQLNTRYLFTNAFANKWKIALNLSLVSAIAIGGVFGFINYKWTILSRLGYQPSKLCDDSEVMKEYIEEGGDLNIQLLEDPKYGSDNPKIKTNLWSCVINKHTKEMVELMIAKGAEVNARDNNGITPLFWAANNHQHEIIELLLAKDADVNTKDNFGSTPLTWAMSHQEEEEQTSLTAKLSTAKLLIAKGANVNAKDDNGITPLHQAARNHQREVAEFLISQGADIHAKDNEGITPLSSAARNYNYEVVEFLISKGADVNSKDNNGITPLLWAVIEAENNSKSELLTVKLLIDKGADINTKDKDGKNVLFKNQVNFDITKLLILKNVDVNARDNKGKTPLMETINPSDLLGFIDQEKLKLLIAKGADVNARDVDGKTPLFDAVSSSNQEIVKLLIDKSVDINAKDKDGETVLFKAVADKDKEIIKLLIDKRADVNVKDQYGRTPLFSAVNSMFTYDNTKKEIAKLLIDNGSNVNARDEDGKTPLFSAVNSMAGDNNKEEEIIKLLINNGANVNVRDKDGKTPLFEAVYVVSPRAVKLLINNGADVNTRDNNGIALLSFAKHYEYQIEDRLVILDILKKNGAKE
ncbi:MAG: ankyrin repeat domain-containing protein [Waterburya sp.]